MSKLVSMFEKQDHYELEYPGGDTKTLDCDIAIVGGGGAGMVAAVRAAELGASVILIEKMSELGGNSWFAGGLLSTTSNYQRDIGMPDKTDHYIETAYKHNKYTLNPALFRRYISNTGTFFEWLIKHGFDVDNTRWIFDAVCLIKERTHPGYLNNPAYGPGLMGSTILTLMKNYLEEHDVPVYTETKVTALLTGSEGQVTGVLANGQKESYHINAGAVILSSGGFGGNMEMLQRFLPQYFSSDNYFSHYCMLSTTGDGIEMAEEIGAEVGKNISVGLETLSHIPGSYSIQKIVGHPLGIVVNKNGKRFICEDSTEGGEFAVDMQPEGVAYYIFDQPILEEAFKKVVDGNRFGDPPPTREELEADLKREKQEGKLEISQTLNGLCGYIGCTAEELQETVDRCNGHFDVGYDNELFKAKENLRPIKEGPFYAVKAMRKFDVTMGGVSINENIQALRPDGSAIGGLYVTGDCASNWMGKDYGPLFSSFAWAMNSGYLAAESAARIKN